MPNILEVQNLAKQYGDFTAVKRVSFDIKEGRYSACLFPMARARLGFAVIFFSVGVMRFRFE